MEERTRPWHQREQRLPLYVQVVARPPLTQCWSVNISASGLGLVTSPGPQGWLPSEGDTLELRFRLPDAGTSLRARAMVMWRHDAPAGPTGGAEGPGWSAGAGAGSGSGIAAAGGAPVVALGLAFTHLQSDDRLSLERYLHAYRFHVGVAGVSAAERAVLMRELGAEVALHFADEDASPGAITDRGDVAAVIIGGAREEALAWCEQFAKRKLDRDVPQAIAPSDHLPRLIFAAPAASAALIRLFNDGVLFRVVAPPWPVPELKAAVLAACRDYGVRTEQRRVALALERALLRRNTRAEVDTAQAPGSRAHVVAESAEMRRVLDWVRTVAPHRVPVLLQGETGSGKEVIARTLHKLSERAQAPFVAQDCGALTETLLESELFGHARGAFTGALTDYPGLFTLADGGSIFLDEIENTTANFQAKLLRIIESGEVRPVGGTQVRRVDVRIIAAANTDLEGLTRSGRFRVDLFYRLNAFPIDVPPLRVRTADILPLARHFLAAANRAQKRNVKGFTERAERALLAHAWPGNVRELRNAVERAVILSAGALLIDVDLLPRAIVEGARAAASVSPLAVAGGPKEIGDAIAAVTEVTADSAATEAAVAAGAFSAARPPDAGGDLDASLARLERALILQALEDSRWVVRKAARRLGVNAVTLARRARRLSIALPTRGEK